MRGGRLRDQVAVEVATRAKDAVGGQRVTWTPALGGQKLFAEVLAGSGGEGLEADKIATPRRWTVTLRYRDDITAANYRFKYGTKIFAILSVLPDQKREMIVCACEEGRANDG